MKNKPSVNSFILFNSYFKLRTKFLIINQENVFQNFSFIFLVNSKSNFTHAILFYKNIEERNLFPEVLNRFLYLTKLARSRA